MRGLGTLWHIRTRKNIRTMQSLLTNTGPARATWPRVREMESLILEKKRLQARRAIAHALRQGGIIPRV